MQGAVTANRNPESLFKSPMRIPNVEYWDFDFGFVLNPKKPERFF
jgi:hypothetical protein